ncbi:MAG: flavin reductase family protein [Ruminococcaceae bacterium]|nr:flavin reductase family protein [Oscillospiraceae bacterium]
MKKMIDPFDYAGEIAKNMKRGILLTTKGKGTVDTMTIGWGTIGIEWGRPVFVAYVRESRYTRELLDENPEFTVNVPIDQLDGSILGFCGTKSGRDVDKIRELDLHLEEPEVVSVPGIRELPLTLECKVIYRNPQPTKGLPQEVLNRYYPEVDGKRDAHIAYYGEIVAAYIIEE